MMTTHLTTLLHVDGKVRWGLAGSLSLLSLILCLQASREQALRSIHGLFLSLCFSDIFWARIYHLDLGLYIHAKYVA